MFLKKLDIYGFKSFADKINIKFDRGITAIVGPNGSGKSNVADAVRWVLGEQSAKSLRGSKMEDVIFSGTEVRKPLGFAEVSLTLDNSDGLLPVDFSEVTITRRVFRSGESEYYINRSSCRLKDIIELFMDTGVGKEGYSIIGQGRIEEILSTKSDNRREIFEEAAGIAKYKLRKEEAEKKLEKTIENLVRVEDILNEIEQRLAPLETQSKVAREYLRLKEQLKFYEINQFIFQYRKYIERIDKLKDQISLLEQDIKNHRDVLGCQETKIEEYRQGIGQIENSIESLKSHRYELLNKVEKIKGEIGVFQEKIQQAYRENDRLGQEIENENCLVAEKESEINKLQQVSKDKKKILEEVKKQSKDLMDRISSINDELTINQEEMKEKRGYIMDILDKISEVKNKTTQYRTIETNLLNRLQNISTHMERLKGEEAAFTSQYEETRNKINELRSSIEDERQKKSNLERALRDKRALITKLENNLQQRSHELEGKRSRLRLLEEMHRDYEGFNKSIREILKACKKNGSFGGKVCGVIAELLEVPREYEIAIETALGGSLQYVVTEDEESAKDIIDFLKRNEFGRATFLPVSSVKSRGLSSAEKAALSMDGCRGIASDLIQFNPKFKGIFENLLGRVVITENLDQAIRVARHFSYSFRIVTLDGDVINPGGAMTGGSRNQRNAGLIGRNREINDLKKQIADGALELERGERDREKCLQEYSQDKKNLENITSSLHQLEIKLTSEEEKLARVQAEYNKVLKERGSLESEAKELDKQLADIQVSIQDGERELGNLETKNLDARTVTDRAEESIKEMMRQKEELERQATDLKVTTTGLEMDIQSIEGKIHQLKNEVGLHRRNIIAKEKQLEENIKGISEYRTGVEGRQGEIETITSEITSIDENIGIQQNNKNSQEVMIKELVKQAKELNQTIEELVDGKHRMDIQLSRYEVELENLQNDIWEEYEISYSNALAFLDENITLSRSSKMIQELKQNIEDLGDVNVNAIDEYKQVRERFDFLNAQKKDLITAKENLRGIINDITKTMEEEFRREFAIINKHFNSVFSQLFGGGKAELVLEDEEDVLGCGIDVIAQPPGKKLQQLSLLSGGEKALTAIAILFAILKRKPTPFCVLDEIEAALDESNVYNFGNFLHKFSKDTQFIVITHRKGTMEASDVLYGIAMEEKGVSKMVSVRLEKEAS